MANMTDVLGNLGLRLRQVRTEQGLTLAEVAADTGISTSTLSRLESGQRKATLELLLPLSRTFQLPLDDLIQPPGGGDPRVQQRPIHRHGMTFIPLTQHVGGLQAYKQVIPGQKEAKPVQQGVHEGYDWIYVLSGRLKLVLGGKAIVLTPGEVAEFDTRVPHGITSADEHDVEILSLFGAAGERMHLRASTERQAPRS
ncbi:MAG: helix-turn-helix transcriptional regulator [Acidobacteria bacterium]|nr:helix-turn-helix transcriptional regulator [Acidobacteriota bacterium]